MITVISGTNRKGSYTEKFAKHFYELFKSKTNESVHYISLQKLPKDILHNEMYKDSEQSKKLENLQKEIIIPAEKFFIVSPEYNGSFPGVLKLFLDAISVHEYRATFKGKKVGLAGVSSGRAGNLRGMDHLTGVFHHVGSEVMPAKLPISNCENLVNDEDEIMNEDTLKAMEKQVDAFLEY